MISHGALNLTFNFILCVQDLWPLLGFVGCDRPRRELFHGFSSVLLYLLILIILYLAEHVHILFTFKAIRPADVVSNFVSHVGHGGVSGIGGVYLRCRSAVDGNLTLASCILGHLMNIEIRPCLRVYGEVNDVIRMEVWNLHA